ncbi:MAG: diguanylate cyclase [Thomasclavelia sp.]|nr:diguanylate cyclase [Thomasclavelia sp.]
MFKKLVTGIGGLVILFGLFNLFSMRLPAGTDITDNVTSKVVRADGTTKTYDSNIFELVGKKDKVFITIDLPKDKKTSNSSLVFQIYHSRIKAKFDNKEIYSYGYDLDKDEFIGGNSYIIPIPSNAWGQKITIELEPTEDSAFSRVPKVDIYKTQYASLVGVNRNPLAFVISLVALITGVTILIVYFVFDMDRDIVINGVLITLFVVCISGYLLIHYGSLSLFFGVNSYRTIAPLEYIFLYLVGLPVLIYMAQDIKQARFKKIIRGIMIFQILFVVVASILHYTNIIHLNQLLIPGQILQFIDIIFILSIIIYDYLHEGHKVAITFIGFIAMCVSAFIDVVAFYAARYLSLNNVVVNDIFFLPIGLYLFVISLLVNYVSKIRDKSTLIQTEQYLQSVAYLDPLSGVNNRSKMNETFNNLSSRKEKNYIIVYFDLNNLKNINDNQGHFKGDEVIKAFGQLISKYFKDIGTIGRMGGDEFVVVVEKESIVEVHKRLQLMEKANKRLANSISYGYGIATSKDSAPLLIEEALYIADNEMYKMKQRQKEGG